MGLFGFFFADTVNCKLYSLNSLNRRTTFPFLHGQIETERTLREPEQLIFYNTILLWDSTDNLCVDVHLIFLLLFSSLVLHC